MLASRKSLTNVPAKVPLTELPVTRVTPAVGLKFLMKEPATPLTVPRATLLLPRMSKIVPAAVRFTAVSA